MLKLASLQNAAQFFAEKLMEEYWKEDSEMNKYLGARPGGKYAIDYHVKFGLQSDPKWRVQGLLHLNNMLLLLRGYHKNQIYIGKSIIEASRETLKVLKQN